MSKKTVVQGHHANFETLKRAFENGDVALMECEIAVEDLFKKGEKVAVICAVYKETQENDEISFTPFATFFNGNPFVLLKSPMQVDEEVVQKHEIEPTFPQCPVCERYHSEDFDCQEMDARLKEKIK